MIKKRNAALIALGAGAILLMSRRRKASPGKRRDIPEENINIFNFSNVDIENLENLEDKSKNFFSDLLNRNTDPHGRAQLGMLYQIKPGDIPFEVGTEALFGSRGPVTDPIMRKAVVDLIVRIDCSPWNQANYGVPLKDLGEDHANIDNYFTKRGVSFNPIYQNNYNRILNGLPPTAEPGHYHAFIWIPMINLDRYDSDGIVTTEGMNYPDSENGMGGSMIDPPDEILDLGFDRVSSIEVGCDLPEGSYRKKIISNI